MGEWTCQRERGTECNNTCSAGIKVCARFADKKGDETEFVPAPKTRMPAPGRTSFCAKVALTCAGFHTRHCVGHKWVAASERLLFTVPGYFAAAVGIPLVCINNVTSDTNSGISARFPGWYDLSKITLFTRSKTIWFALYPRDFFRCLERTF